MTVPAAANPEFDPSQAVPEVYDVFCQGCGYSLVGLNGARCPECGRDFDPTELPYARIPWLHRRRIGRIRAYWRTVAMVMFRPARFAAELCRPVRISADDARRFRHLTIWMTAICFVLAAVVSPVVATVLRLSAVRWTPRGSWPMWIEKSLTTNVSILLPSMIGFYVLLRLATDMPLFIWKGLPALAPNELSPVHRYASAPLAVAAAGILLIGAMMPFAFGGPRHNQLFTNLVPLCAAGVAIGWAAWTRVISLRMMKAAGRATRRQMLLLAVYLPLHWLMVSGLVLMAVFEFEMYVFRNPDPLMRVWIW